MTYFFRCCAAALFAAAFLFSSVGSAQEGAAPAAAALAQQGPSSGSESTVPGYRLGSGDKVRVTVFGEMDLSGEYEVDGTGLIRMPLIGEVRAGGLTMPEFEQAVRAKLAEGYLNNPRISMEVINYRPFYIIGEVNKPGEYPYVNGMTILNAIALAGGYTYRASASSMYIQRGGSEKEQSVSASEATKIFPGDIIRVPERFF